MHAENLHFHHSLNQVRDRGRLPIARRTLVPRRSGGGGGVRCGLGLGVPSSFSEGTCWDWIRKREFA